MHKFGSANSIWLGAFVALLVALGADVLISSVTPTSLAELQLLFTGARDPHIYYRLNPEPMWLGESIIRLLSFSLGGIMAVRMVGHCSFRLLVLLLVSGAVSSFIGPFPKQLSPQTLSALTSTQSFMPLLVWLFSAPIGIILGALAAKVSLRTV